MRSLLLGLAILSFAAPALAEESCKLARFGMVDALNGGVGVPVIAARIEDRPVRFTLDTGAGWSFLETDAAGGLQEQKLPEGFFMQDAAGGRATKAVHAPNLSFGPFSFPGMQFVVAHFSLLGHNVLKVFDIELDPVERKVGFYKNLECDRSPVYWPHGEVAVVPFSVDRDGWISFEATLDGKAIRTLLDTGASLTELDDRFARTEFGVTPDSGGTDPSPGLTAGTGRTIEEYRHQFKSLEFAGFYIQHPWIRIGIHGRTWLSSGSTPPLVLGMDQLASLHLFISYGQHKLYFTTVQGDLAAGRKMPPGVVDPQIAQNVRELVESAANAARAGDPARAGALLDRAVGLTADAPDALIARARFRRGRGDVAGAAADLAAADGIPIGNGSADFLRRAVAFSEVGDMDRAIRDATKAIELAPGTPEPLAARAGAYISTKRYDAAIADGEAAVRLAPQSARWLNLLCWAEALAGRLDEALGHCDAALAINPKLAAALDSRGFVNLRSGRWVDAIKDYDAALSIDPRLAASLWGRSVAKARSNDADGAKKDLDAARAIDPRIESRYAL